MSDLEDLSAKAARLWFEFMQAQAKAATDAAEKLPEVTRSLAEAGVPSPRRSTAGSRVRYRRPAPQMRNRRLRWKRRPRLRAQASHQGMISLASRRRPDLSVSSVAAIIAG